MKTLILATGTTREAHLRALEAEYLGRFPAKIRPEVRELTEGKTAAQTAAAQLAALAALPAPAYVIALDERGALLTSPAWAAQLAKVAGQGVKTLAFLIGSADGLTDEVKNHCQAVWALGKLTFPHQLVRGLLAEQLYRAHTLNTGHPYHRP
ncbi:MAG: 23S rRNA (pseudouridine(1915)-N(3))-methyltransferase RlmH [Alphaproteobacteria bacterium]|jgi:23S rRNA (pseudouridine1915-N3)-methyltransferase|nr:23S rRNA (pseudouridine(1915)-N(3))-methyltransferase RlmH [Alphaproteobacteria bacterium]